jgi:hypothetical protein
LRGGPNSWSNCSLHSLALGKSAQVLRDSVHTVRDSIDFEESQIRQIVEDDITLADLVERAPIRFDDERSHAEEIIDILFPGDPLLCVAKSSYDFRTRRRSTWRGHLHRLPLIVPNPMLDIIGHTVEGRLSEHTKEKTARRVYLSTIISWLARGKKSIRLMPGCARR